MDRNQICDLVNGNTRVSQSELNIISWGHETRDVFIAHAPIISYNNTQKSPDF